MLFHSPGFIFFFLPLVLLTFFALGRFARPLAAAWLGLASLVFYAWWSTDYLWLIGCSILFNYLVGRMIVRETARAAGRAGFLLAAGVAGNVALLAYYKYANFFLATGARIAGLDYVPFELILPLGISFFTFTQIAFLVDARRGLAREYHFIHYVLFVTYYPHLIAGPILHHAEMMPQFAQREIYTPQAEKLAAGSVLFVFGLFKKIVLADGIAPYAIAVFDAPAKGAVLSVADAWGGALAYTMQLYFDFSGYSDMAIGLSLMMGVQLPLNFNSPYKATSIIDFWTRWHMTLSRFLRDYLYIPLGGNRRGPRRRYVNLVLTMVLGGLWHGAGWTFVAWGGLHGAYLCINHAWRSAVGGRSWARTRGYRIAAAALTFLAVVAAWVFFRADTMGHAVDILAAMAGLEAGTLASTDGGKPFPAPGAGLLVWLALSFVVIWMMPNTQQIVLDARGGGNRLAQRLHWRPTLAWGACVTVLAVSALARLHGQSQFLYFQF